MAHRVSDMAELDNRKKEISFVRHVLYSATFAVLLFACAILQCSGIKILGQTPDMVFGLVCAIGFIAKEKYGGIFGLLGGVLIMALGSGTLSLSPVLFTLCGYLCGALPGLILRRNFSSFTVFAVMMGAIHTFFTAVYYVMISQSYEIWSVIGGEFFSDLITCIICMIPAYFAVLGIYNLFKGNDNKRSI